MRSLVTLMFVLGGGALLFADMKESVAGQLNPITCVVSQSPCPR